MRNFQFALVLFLLAGCAGKVQMMPRDSGKIYSGTVNGNGSGSGTMVLTIDDETYTGPVVRTSPGDSFGLLQQYGSKGTSSFGTVVSSGGTANVKAMLASPNGRGLRCELTSRVSVVGVYVSMTSRAFTMLSLLSDSKTARFQPQNIRAHRQAPRLDLLRLFFNQ